MKEGDVVLTALPQSDGVRKNRPVIVLRQMPRFGDSLVCGVSSQIHQAVSGFDHLIHSTDADFSTTGLKGESVIRLGFLAVIPSKDILGTIGSISPDRHRSLLQTLCSYLSLDQTA